MTQGSAHPPKARLVLRVGVTGHRWNKIGSNTEVVEAKVRAAIEVIKEKFAAVHDEAQKLGCYSTEPPLMRIISSLAEGADQIAAKEAVAPCSELHVVLPFVAEEYERDFATEASRDEFRVLLARATAVMTLDGARTSKATEDKSYRAAGLMMLRQCDVVIAVWDGEPPVSSAGTGAIAADAIRLDLPVVWINTLDLTVAPVLLTGIGAPADGEPHRTLPLTFLARSLQALLLPPGAGGDEAVSEAAADGPLSWLAYFAQAWPRRSWLGFVYTLFVVLFAWERRRPRLKMPRRDKRLCTAKGEGFTHGRFAEHYVWADQLADQYGAAHRGGYVLGFSLAPIAVFLAVFGIGCQWASRYDAIWAVLELLTIGFILALVLWAKCRRWHARWLEYRFLAEQLRQMRMLAPLGRVPRSMQACAHHAFAAPEASLASWQFRAAVREAGLFAESLDHGRRWHLATSVVLPLIRDQVRYHQHVHRRHARVARNLERTHLTLFGMTLIVVAAHVVHEWPHLRALCFPVIEKFVPKPLNMLAAVLPAVGASFAARATQGEFHRLAERSEAMAERLEALARNIEAMPDPSATQLGDLAEEAANLMIEEVLDWRVMLLARPAQLPA